MVAISRKQRCCIESAVHRAVKSGELVKPDICSKCGVPGKKLDGHHKDYEQPLVVVWVCRKCHKQRHKGNGSPKRQDIGRYKGNRLPVLDISPHETLGLFRETNCLDEHKYFDAAIDWEPYLEQLTYREREIIKLRYGISDGCIYTLQEIGKIFKVTRERVRCVEAKAIMKLRKMVF